MSTDEKIFGPLNLKQFIYCAGGFGVVFFSYRYLPLNMTIGVTILAVVVVFSTFINQPVIVFDENYIRAKRQEFDSPEKYQRWLQKKIAEIQAQIYIRKERGLTEDPELDKALKNLESALKQ